MKNIKVTCLKRKMRWTVTLTLMKEMNLTASRRRMVRVGRAEWSPKPIRCIRFIKKKHHKKLSLMASDAGNIVHES